MAQARLYLQRDLTVHVNALSQDLVRRGVRPHRRLFLSSSGGQEGEKKERKRNLAGLLPGVFAVKPGFVHAGFR